MPAHIAGPKVNMARKMMPGSRLELRTDDEDYRDQMLAVLESSPAFVNELGPGEFALDPQSDNHIPTIFESKFREEGRPIHYFYYRRDPEVQCDPEIQ